MEGLIALALGNRYGLGRERVIVLIRTIAMKTFGCKSVNTSKELRDKVASKTQIS